MTSSARRQWNNVVRALNEVTVSLHFYTQDICRITENWNSKISLKDVLKVSSGRTLNPEKKLRCQNVISKK